MTKNLRDYTCDCEMIGKLSIGDQIRKTHIKLRFIDDFENFINSIDGRYDAEDAISNGYIYKLNPPQFNLINWSQYGNGCAFKHQIIEYRGKNCYIPSNGFC